MAKQPITSFNDDDWYIFNSATGQVYETIGSKEREINAIRATASYPLLTVALRGYRAKHHKVALWNEVQGERPAVKAVVYSNGATEMQQCVAPVAALPGQFSVSYGTQCFNAKDPNGLQRKLQFMADKEGLRRLAENLLHFCNS